MTATLCDGEQMIKIKIKIKLVLLEVIDKEIYVRGMRNMQLKCDAIL